MNRLCIILGAIIAASCAHCAADDRPFLKEARIALQEGIPQVAAQKLRTGLETADLSPEERSLVIRLLAEALISAGQCEEALSRLELLQETSAEMLLLRAQALSSLGKWNEALQLFQTLASGTQPPHAARRGEAECLAMVGRHAEAAKVLQSMMDADSAGTTEVIRLAGLYIELGSLDRARSILARVNPAPGLETNWRNYVEGRLYLAEKQPLAARDLFDKLIREQENRTESLLFGATLGLTDATVELGGNEAASAVLERFINDHPHSAYLDTAFRRLDQIYMVEEDPSGAQLLNWIQQPPPRRASLGTFYLARLTLRERKYEKTAALLKYFTQAYANHPLLCEVYVMQADVFLAQHLLADAIPVLEAAMREASNADQRGEIELRTGIVHHQQGEYLLAANLFRSAAERSPRLSTVSTFNAALAWLSQRSEVPYAAELRKLVAKPEGVSLQSELLLERGLLQARSRELRAEETLQLFLHQNPRHSRAGEARLALAELEYQSLRETANPQQRTKAARRASEYLRVVNAEARSPEIAEHADYLAVFLADTAPPKTDSQVIELGKAFLKNYKDSQFVSDVRMKLGQVYFRSEDFANAETQFATLVEENPESRYSETALFLAGQSAMKLARNPEAFDRALSFFNRVANWRGGALKLYARQEQAIAQSRVGRDEEAIFLYDLILSAQPAPGPELRQAALCGKGDSLRTLGRKDPSKLEAAVTVFNQLAESPNVTPTWRNQALYKKAKTLEQLGRNAEALTAFYDVLERSTSSEREHFWSGKAGFDAGTILEQQEQWKPAIAIYEKLARLEGPRAREASDRVKEIRLKHFVWD